MTGKWMERCPVPCTRWLTELLLCISVLLLTSRIVLVIVVVRLVVTFTQKVVVIVFPVARVPVTTMAGDVAAMLNPGVALALPGM